ncbi:hypothetical protein D039_1903B, partial [Vibrio parahaemolyticus EKP-028]
GLHQIGTD